MTEAAVALLFVLICLLAVVVWTLQGDVDDLSERVDSLHDWIADVEDDQIVSSMTGQFYDQDKEA